MKKQKVKKFVLSHRFHFTLVIIIIGILLMILPQRLFGFLQAGCNSDLETTYYMSQIISAVFVIAGVVIAAWQYYLTSKAEISKFQLERVQKSFELAQFYKDEILSKFSAVKYVYQKTGLLDIVNKIKETDMKDFTRPEMEKILCKNDIDMLKELEQSDEFIKSILEANIIYNLKVNIVKKQIVVDDKTEWVIDKRPIIVGFLAGLISNIMNDLECFSMYFTHKAADDSVVFQSLHQTYIELVHILYYQIAMANDMQKGVYYTNVTELFIQWYKESYEANPTIKTVKGTTVSDISVDK